MGYMLSHYLNLPPYKAMGHAKFLFKFSPSLLYKTMGFLLSHFLNLPHICRHKTMISMLNH